MPLVHGTENHCHINWTLVFDCFCSQSVSTWQNGISHSSHDFVFPRHCLCRSACLAATSAFRQNPGVFSGTRIHLGESSVHTGVENYFRRNGRMRRNSMDFAWNQHTRLDTNCVYRNCSCSRRSNDQTKTICLNPCGKVTVVAINIWFGRRVISP